MSIFEYDKERELRIIKQDSYDAGFSDGITLGQRSLAKLTAHLLEDNRLDELKQLSQDTLLCEKLLTEYSIN